MSWSDKYKRSIDCDNPQGFSQKSHCAARKKRQKGEKTKSKSPFNEMHEIKSHKTVEQIAKKHRLEVSFVKNQLKMGIPIEHEHTKDKDLATDIALQHLDEIPDYYTRLKKMEADAKKHHKKFKDVKEGTLHHWFKGSSSKDGKPGWVQADGSPCANEPGETKTPKCFSSSRLKALKAKGDKGESLIKSAIRRKREGDKNQQQKSGAARPTNVPTFAKGKEDKNYVKAEPGIKESMELNEAQKDRPSKGSGTKDACYHKVKSRYDVWPSAYASGALVKCRKVGADNWGTKSEETAINEGQKCWPGYKKKGTKKMFGKTYNNCVKVNEEGEMLRYCPKCKKDETRSECSYGPKFWDLYSMPSLLGKKYDPNKPHPGNFPESYDHEHSMARSELATIASAVKRLKKKMKGEGNIEAWVQSKITKAADYLDSAADYVDSGEMKSESVGSSVKLKPGSGLGGGVQVYPSGQGPKRKSGDPEPQLPNLPGGFVKQAKAPSKKKLQVAHYELDGEIVDEGLGKLAIGAGLAAAPYLLSKLKPAVDRAIDKERKTSKIGGDRYNNQLKQLNQEYEGENDLVEYSNWREDFGLSEDWQKVNRQDKTDGLSPAAVKAYRRENPGSKLQTAVTEKKPKGKRAKRRANFCRRMKGMKSKLTSTETARDPDSRINKALRRWRCN